MSARPPSSAPRRARTARIRQVLDGVRRLERGLRIAARRVERETGLSAAQLFVLQQLSDGPAASLNDLAARTLTDRSSVSVVVDRLVRARLVTRRMAEHDRRRQEVRITASGRAMLSRAPTPPGILVVTALKRLSPTSVRQLAASLAALNDALGFEDTPMLFADDD